MLTNRNHENYNEINSSRDSCCDSQWEAVQGLLIC